MSSEKLDNKFDQFAKDVKENNILGKKITVMLHLIVTMAIGCHQ